MQENQEGAMEHTAGCHLPVSKAAAVELKRDNGKSPGTKKSFRGRSGTDNATHSSQSRAPKPRPKSSQAFGRKARSKGYYSNGSGQHLNEPLTEKDVAALYSGRGSHKHDISHLFEVTFNQRQSGVTTNYYGHVSVTSGGHRRKQGGPAYAKLKLEQYLQANCQFVVKDGKNYIEQSIDPDKLVDWDNIEQVLIRNVDIPSCPICLDTPYAAKITRCGHVFCWSCLLHYLALDTTSWVPCPVCKAPTWKNQLKSVSTTATQRYSVGDTLTLKLMKREKGSVYTMPVTQWTQREGLPHTLNDEVDTCFAKLFTASRAEIRRLVIEPEREVLTRQLVGAQNYEACFIEQALVLLKEREEELEQEGSARAPGSDVSVSPTATDTEAADRARTTSASSDSSSLSVLTSAGDACDGAAAATTPRSVTARLHLDSSSAASAEDARSTSFADDASSVGEAGALSGAASSVADDNYSGGSGSPTPPESGSGETRAMTSRGQPAARMQGQEGVSVEEAAEQLELPPTVKEGRDNSKRKNARAPAHRPSDTFYFYQAADGQHIYLHSLNARCLVEEYGSLDQCPETLTARVVALEGISMTEELRKRLRYLNHLPLSCQFQVAELHLEPPVVSRDTLAPFTDAIEKRRRERTNKQRAEKRHSKLAEIELKKRLGQYPDLRYRVESAQHFPPVPERGGERQRAASATEEDAESLASSQDSFASPYGSPPEVDADMSYGGGVSYSKVLRQQATEAPAVTSSRAPAWPARLAAHHVAPRAAGPGGEGVEDVPVASLQQAWAQSFTAAPAPAQAQGNGENGGGKKKNKKKKEKVLLFSTDMRTSRQ